MPLDATVVLHCYFSAINTTSVEVLQTYAVEEIR